LNLWDAAIKPAIENSGMTPLRTADVAQRYEDIMEGVRQQIIDAEVIIAVLTDENPTVMYELGLAHAAKKKVIMLLEQEQQPPPNFSHTRVLSYDPTDFPQTRSELTKWLQSPLQFDDLFPELPIRSKQDLEEYEYLKQARKTLTIKVTPRNCSIFFNNRLLGASPQTIHVNPEAERNVVSIYAPTYFEHYQVLTREDLEAGVLQIEMELRNSEKYSKRVHSWLMRVREDPDNPVLLRAIGRYLWDQGDLETARKEAQLCVLKAPEWFVGYNLLGRVEASLGNYEQARAYFQIVSDLNPDHYLAWQSIARTESMAGNYPAALEALEKIIASPQLRESYRQVYYRHESHSIERNPAFDPLRSHPEFKERFADIVCRLTEIAAAPEPPLIAEPSPDIRQTEGVQPLPYTLKQFQIANFHCIVRTGVSDIPVDCPWIFITGENGDGKTSLLQALAIGLNGAQDADHLLDEVDCVIDVEVQENGVSHLRHFYWENDHWKANEPARNLLAYGPARLSIQGELSMDRERGQNSPVYSLLHQTGNLRNIEHWLKDLTLEGIREDGSKDWSIFSRIEKVKQLLVDLMPHVTEIELKGKNVLYKEKGHFVPAHHLGSGHKSILAMIGDMLIRLFEAQPEVTEPQALKGIVLIDELENHLHPRWQREFPQKLSQTFPLVQFIATTHSVLPFLGAPEGSVFLKVSRDEKEGTTVERLEIDVANLLPNSLLTSPLFDLDSILSKQNRDFSKLRTADDYKEILRQMERDKRLEEYAQKGTRLLKAFMAPDGKDS
ncbi:AAA family ATPase, partial [Candidatus Poribacteria bacterium]|nr:AAA family ATPase [Candidatus Poribacteria bacterium]